VLRKTYVSSEFYVATSAALSSSIVLCAKMRVSEDDTSCVEAFMKTALQ
jgi:hypothetical protein